MGRKKKIIEIPKVQCPNCKTLFESSIGRFSWVTIKCPDCGKVFVMPEDAQKYWEPKSKYIVFSSNGSSASVMHGSSSWHRNIPSLRDDKVLNERHQEEPFRLFETPEKASAAVYRLRQAPNAKYDWNATALYWGEVIDYSGILQYTGAWNKIENI